MKLWEGMEYKIKQGNLEELIRNLKQIWDKNGHDQFLTFFFTSKSFKFFSKPNNKVAKINGSHAFISKTFFNSIVNF